MICDNFKYPKLLEYFETISAIPRGSYNEQKIAAYLVDFAKERSLEVYTDKYNNVLINMPASAGCEDKAPILLQGHTDMVCEANIGTEHDFLKDPLDLFLEDGLVGARGTTLGADDGVAVAIMLAILDGAVENHGAIQCLFTASEEVGLDGASGFDYSKIYARRMINMDGAEEDTLVVGCAGGVRSDAFFNVEYKDRSKAKLFKITIGGLMGGHSGENIHQGRANANKLAAALLRALVEGVHAELVSFEGGSKENAIPREAVLVVAADNAGAVEGLACAFEISVKGDLVAEDSDFFVSCETLGEGGYDKVFAPEFTKKILDFSDYIENGVLRMSPKIKGLVEFSRNLGIVKCEDGKIGFYHSSRSAIDSQLEESMQKIERAAGAIGGVVKHHGRYPGWEYDKESHVRDAYCQAYNEITGDTAVPVGVHAGIECGVIRKAIPDMDAIAISPDFSNGHSPQERLDLDSCEVFGRVVARLIELI